MRDHLGTHEIAAIVLAAAAASIAGAPVASAQIGRDADTAGRAFAQIDQAADPAAGGPIPSARGLNDAQVNARVQAALTRDRLTSGVRSDVRNGVASLNGTVATEADKQRAELTARRVEGVTRVRNVLVVTGPGASPPASPSAAPSARGGNERRYGVGSAEDILVTARLRADPELGRRNINVRTRNGALTLTGEVESVAEKEAAGRIATETAPGIEIRNEIEVRSDD